MLELNDVHFRYAPSLPEVLKGVSFRSEPDRIISVLGPNGTGKTTFLKNLTGVYSPTSGSVKIDGKNISSIDKRELARQVAFVPQSVPVNRMSVFDNVLLGRRPYISLTARNDDLEIVENVIQSLGMEQISLKYADEISGGEFQKTQIARAIAQEPSVLVLDEPANNLDIANQHLTMKTIMDAVRSRGLCTVMTMHDINLAIHYSDYFLFLFQGKVEAYGGKDVITKELIKKVYGYDVDILQYRGLPLVVPAESPKYTAKPR